MIKSIGNTFGVVRIFILLSQAYHLERSISPIFEPLNSRIGTFKETTRKYFYPWNHSVNQDFSIKTDPKERKYGSINGPLCWHLPQNTTR